MSCTKLQLPREPLTRGLPPPDPRSLCPLSSTEFVEPPPPNKIPGYATGPWPPGLFSKIQSNVRPSSFRSFKRFLEFRFPHQHPVSIAFLLHTCHMPSPISASLLLSPEYGLECTTDHKAPQCADFPSLPLHPPSYVQTCSSSLQGICQSPRPGVAFRNTLNFLLRAALLYPRPASELEDYLLSSDCYFLFSILAANRRTCMWRSYPAFATWTPFSHLLYMTFSDQGVYSIGTPTHD